MSSDGWTVVTPPASARIIYVSSSTGNDSNSGLSPSAPVATIAAGESLLQNDSADEMLLMCGDAWASGLGNWRLSGESAQDPMVIGSYGTGARPLLDTGTGSGFWAASSSVSEISNVDILGIHFYADGRDPNSPTYVGPTDTTGIQVLTKTNDLLIENCWIEDYAVNINLQSFYGPITNASVRRNIIDDAYATTSHSQGLYCYGVNNLTIEGNDFDANGYNSQVPGAGATYYNHDCYLSSNNTNVTIDDNIFANAAGYGLQDRPGGIVENNVFIDDPVDMSFGLVNGATSTPGGVSGIVNGNVFLGGANLDGSPYGQGLVLGNTAPGYPTIVSNNIFADSWPSAPAAITLTQGFAQTNPQQSVGLNDLIIEDNIVNDWDRGVYVDGGFDYGGTGIAALNNVTIRGNDFADVSGPVIQSKDALNSSQLHFLDNTYSATASAMTVASKSMSFSQWSQQDETGATQATVPYANPADTLGAYDASLGGVGTDTDFLASARTLSQQNWQTQYTAAGVVAAMQGAYTDTASPQDWTAPTPPIVSAVAMPATVIAKQSSLEFSVTYLGKQAIDLASLSSGNLTVTARGYSAPASYVSETGSGTQITATYALSAPAASFIQGRRYKFTVTVNDAQITDSLGFPVPAGSAGTFKVRVVRRPAPPRVVTAKIVNRGQALSMRFSSDVSANLNVADLAITSQNGESIPSSVMAVAWDAANDTATWTFPGETGGALSAGQWTLQLDGSNLTDPLGQPLHGNRGNNFVMRAAVAQ